MKGQTATARNLEIALAGYILLLALQLSAYFITHIAVLLATAFEVLSSLLVATLLLFSTFRSQKPPDEVHMFGYGRVQNVASLVAATIFVTYMSVEVFRQAIPQFFQNTGSAAVQRTDLALIVMAISVAVPIFPIGLILRTGEKTAAMKAQMVSSLEDLSAYIAGLVGIVFAGKGFYLAVPISSVVVGIVIVLFGIFLFRENARYLLGKAPSAQLIKKIESTALSVNGVLGVRNLRGEYVGHGIVQAGLEIEVARGTLVEDADKIAHEVQDRISRDTGCEYCVVHIHPAKSPGAP